MTPRTTPVRPRIRAGFSAVRRGAETHVTSGRIDVVSVLDDPLGEWFTLLRACDGTRDVADLHRRLLAEGHERTAGDVAEAIDELDAVGFVVEGADDVDDAWVNQRAYLEQFATAELGAEQALAAVRNACVLVLGAGGVGSWLAHALALMGVRELVVVDPDHVEGANLTRQLYAPGDLGVRKIEALGRSLRRYRPDLAYRGVAALLTESDDLGALLDGVDFVAGCADHPSADDAAELVARACVPRRVPHLAAAYAGPVARIGPTWLPHGRRVACQVCLSLVRERDDSGWSITAAEGRELKPRRAAVTVAQAQLVAALAATEILHVLAGIRPATAGRVVALDLRVLRTYRSRVARQPDCPLCGPKQAAGVPAGRRSLERREEVSA